MGQESVGTLLAADRDLHVLVVDYLPGVLVERTDAESDLGRLAVQQWRGRPDLEDAFLEVDTTALDPDAVAAAVLGIVESGKSEVHHGQ